MSDDDETTKPHTSRRPAPRALPWYATLQFRRVLGGARSDGALLSLLREQCQLRYTVQPWAVDRDPPPSIRWVYIWLLVLGLAVATCLAYPQRLWVGLVPLASISPFAAAGAFYSLRSWSRPRPMDEAREAHLYHQAQARRLHEEGDPDFRYHVPISFAAGLQASIVVNVTFVFGIVGNFVMFAVAQYDEHASLQVGLIVWSTIIVLGLFAVTVGMLAWPRWPMPYVVREAARRGETAFKAEDYRAP